MFFKQFKYVEIKQVCTLLKITFFVIKNVIKSFTNPLFNCHFVPKTNKQIIFRGIIHCDTDIVPSVWIVLNTIQSSQSRISYANTRYYYKLQLQIKLKDKRYKRYKHGSVALYACNYDSRSQQNIVYTSLQCLPTISINITVLLA